MVREWPLCCNMSGMCDVMVTWEADLRTSNAESAGPGAGGMGDVASGVGEEKYSTIHLRRAAAVSLLLGKSTRQALESWG